MITVTGDKEVIERFQRLPATVRGELAQTVQKLAIRLQRKVKEEKLRGQVLNVRSGRLNRSIDQVVKEDGQDVVGVVSTNVKYARRHEYGFAGTEKVRAHLRMIKQAWGRPIEAREVAVREHDRAARTPEKSFLRSALREMRPQIVEDMRRAAGQGMQS